MSKVTLLLLLPAALLLAGCATVARVNAPTLPAGDPQRGQALFSQASIRNTSGCVTCHSMARYKVVVGPSLWGVSTRAGRIIQSPGYKGTAGTAEQYLRESITRPEAYVTAGFAHSVMPDWLTVLDEQQIQDLVAYLSTLKE